MRILYLLFFLIMIGCQSDSKELPVLSYKINDGEKVFYTVKYEDFTNQLGEPFSTRSIENKVIIANFFFTSCPSICPPMRAKLIEVAERLKDEDNFMMVSHTIDPTNDSVDKLKSYADATEINPSKWQFVRASEDYTKKQANQFMTNFKPNEKGTDFYHSSYVALVDKNQQIRGFYNILVDDEIERMTKDISLLLAD